MKIPFFKFLKISVLPFLLITLAGCPHMIEKQVDQLRPPKDYKPIYTTTTVPFKKLLEQYKSAGDSAFKNYESDSAAAEGNSPIRMEVRAVNDRSYPNEIELRVAVNDTTGRFIRGLAPPSFAGSGDWRDYWTALYDSCSGQNSRIENFTVTEVRDNEREPYAIAFVLDHSPSMGELRATKMQEAIARTLRIIKPGDQVSVIKFTANIQVEVPLTGDSAAFKSQFKVNGLKDYDGGTAFYDAASAGISQVIKAPESFKKAIILFTDGDDNSSKAKLDSVIRFAKAHHAAIYSIAYGLTDEKPLRELAHYSGGRFYRMYSNKEFPYVFADIYRSLNNYYKITYRPPQCEAHHTAQVVLKIPELSTVLKATGEYDRSVFTKYDETGSIALVNIEFESGSADIRPESMPRIREIADVLKNYSSMKIEIRGHTDNEGSAESNQKLSEQRAGSVMDALLKMGISKSRMKSRGFGENSPVAKNDTEENRRKNRRTEFIILEK